MQPDILVLRTEKHLTNEVRRKVALFCNVDVSAVVESIDVPTIYEVPLMMLNQKLDIVALDKLQRRTKASPIWRNGSNSSTRSSIRTTSCTSPW